MNDLDGINELWRGIVENLSHELTPTSIATWFSDCTVVDMTEGKLVLHTSTKFKRDILEQRFVRMIKQNLYEIFTCDFEVLILAGDEVDTYREENADRNILPEMDGYTFDHFIVGDSNKFAHAAAMAVSEKPGRAYNPLFIYGNSGLGKTHLLLAIGSAIHERNPRAKIAYIKGDDFTNQLVTSIQQGTAHEFRSKYRSADLFLVDDIQFIAGKERTQEEFFHTFNNIYEAGHQIVITSDRPPLEMAQLDDRLRTRFEGGLLADIQPPDIETRMAIIRNKSGKLGMALPDSVVSYIAETITSNIRQIEGVVKRLTAYRDIMQMGITVEIAKRAIKDVIRVGTYIPTPSVIIEETARYFQISSDDVTGQRRNKNIALARHISIYLIRNLTNLSLNDIGAIYEDRNHATIYSSIKKIEELLDTDPSMAGIIRDITSNINLHKV